MMSSSDVRVADPLESELRLIKKVECCSDACDWIAIQFELGRIAAIDERGLSCDPRSPKVLRVNFKWRTWPLDWWDLQMSRSTGQD
jgi:hypothetical protein